MQHNPAKIALSKDELELVIDAQILLTKNGIIQKVYEMFGVLAEQYSTNANSIFPEAVAAIPPKISRGENYQGLPYVILDYPRYFKKEEAFAIRTLFWWGNFFSITLQLSGVFLEKYKTSLSMALQEGKLEGWYINSNDNMWEHHFNVTNYIPVDFSDSIANKSALKLAKKIPLHQWDKSLLFLHENYLKLLTLLQH